MRIRSHLSAVLAGAVVVVAPFIALAGETPKKRRHTDLCDSGGRPAEL